MVNLAMIGYSGSGKSTMAKDFAEEFKFVHIETGKLFRKMVDDQTKTGQKLDKYISKGELVPDELVCDIVNQKIEENINSKGIIFDGFPRTREQAKCLEEKLQEKSTDLHFVFLLKIKEELARKRSFEKLNTKDAVSYEEGKNLINTRIEVQRKHLKELRKYFNKENKLFEYNAYSSFDSVQWGIRKIIMRKLEE